MFKYLILLFFCSIVFISCDGRDRANKTNIDVSKESELLDSFKKKKYFENQKRDIIYDSIIKKHKIQIEIVIENKNEGITKDSAINKSYTRNLYYVISISMDDEILMRHEIKDILVIKKDLPINDILKYKIVEDISIKKENTYNKPNIDITICKPEYNDICTTYKFAHNGKMYNRTLEIMKNKNW